MNKEERTILIEKYLDGELQGVDLISFELNLKNDIEFVQDYSLQKEIRNTISNKDIFELREKLIDIKNNFEKEKQFKLRRRPVLLFALTSVIVISILSSVFILNNSSTNNDLYEEFYEQYDVGKQTRGVVEPPTKDILIQAIRSYDNKEYENALKLFNQINDTSQFFIPKEYYTGLSYMELCQFEMALKHLKIVANDKQSVFRDNAIWYSGLCYLKTNKTKDAIYQFKILLNCKSFYQKRATQILEKLE